LWIWYRDREGNRHRESAETRDWHKAQKKLRERLLARDGNVLEIVLQGEKLCFGEWCDFFLENYSKPPFRSEKTHIANDRAVKHLRKSFQSRKLVDITAEEVEMYLRRRLQDRVRFKTRKGFTERGKLKPSSVHQEFRVLRRVLGLAVKKKFLPANPCAGVEFPTRVEGLFRPHYMTWSEQERIEFSAPPYLRNIIRIVTETGLRIYKELALMRKDQVDLENAVVWIPDSKTPSGIADVPLTDVAVQAFRDQIANSGPGPWLFPSQKNPESHQASFKKCWRTALRKAEVPYFRIYDLRSTYATRLSAGGVADEWVTQLLRQGDAQVFKRYSQMKLQMKREALAKLNRHANESAKRSGTAKPN
jgi:integrase